MPVHRTTFFQIMSAFPTGVAIVTTLEPDGTPRGLTTNAVTSVSADPPILLVCVDRDSRTLPALRQSRRFVVNFMRDDHAEICELFASKAEDKFASVAWTPGSKVSQSSTRELSRTRSASRSKSSKSVITSSSPGESKQVPGRGPTMCRSCGSGEDSRARRSRRTRCKA